MLKLTHHNREAVIYPECNGRGTVLTEQRYTTRGTQSYLVPGANARVPCPRCLGTKRITGVARQEHDDCPIG